MNRVRRTYHRATRFISKHAAHIAEGFAWAGAAASCVHVGLTAAEIGAAAGAPTGPADPAIAIGAGLAGCAIAIYADVRLHEALRKR